MTVTNPQIIKKVSNLSERNRPKTWDTVMGQDDIKSSLREMIARYKKLGHMPPHLMFKGPSGTGKTTIAYIYANEFLEGGIKRDVNFFEFNGSDDRGIKVMQEKIKPLTRIVNIIIIFISEADRLTDEAQGALRRITELTQNARFIFDLNEENKIIDAMKSRCAEFTFRPLDEDHIIERIYQVFDAEGIKSTMDTEEENAIRHIIHTSRGDMRKIFNNLEKVITADKTINSQNILELNNSINIVADCVKQALAGDFDKAKNLIEDAYIMSGYSTDLLVDGFLDAIATTITNKELQVWAYIRLGELAHRLENSRRPLCPLWSFVGELWRASYLKRQ